MLDPETGLFIFLITGISGVLTYTAFHTAEIAGPKLTLRDMLPLTPWEGPPLPRFTKTHPGLLAELRRR